MWLGTSDTADKEEEFREERRGDVIENISLHGFSLFCAGYPVSIDCAVCFDGCTRNVSFA